MTLTLTARIGLGGSLFQSGRTGTLSQIPSLPKIGVSAQGISAFNATQTLNQSLFASKLEKHIDDVRHGEDYLTQDVGAAVAEKSDAASSALAASDPEALKNYSAYLTVLSYDKKARYVNSVDGTTKAVSTIPSEEEAKAATDELVKAFYPER
jgi:hypothetical protein